MTAAPEVAGPLEVAIADLPAAPIRHYYRGRVALLAILHGLGAGPRDEVVLQAYTCLAVPQPLLRLGVRPVYVDIDRTSLTLDIDQLRAAITPRTRAVIVQHTFGAPADLAAVQAVTAPAGVPVIEDCAHVLGGRLGGRPLGQIGAAAFFSYEWGKPVVAGVGGSAMLNEPQLARRVLSMYGAFAPPPRRRELLISSQYLAYQALSRARLFWQARAAYRRLSRTGMIVGSYADGAAASSEYAWQMSRPVARRLARRQQRAEASLARRATVEARYWAALEDLGFDRLRLPAGADAVMLRVPIAVADKPRVLRRAAHAGIELGDWYATPVHPLTGDQLSRSGYRPGSCPNAQWAADHVVTLPVRSTVDDDDIDRAIELLARLRADGDA